MTATVLAFRPRAVAVPVASPVGGRIAYSDMANPRREGTIARGEGVYFVVEWDHGGTSSIHASSVPAEPGGREAGWTRLAPDGLTDEERALRNALAALAEARGAKERAKADALCYGSKYNRDLSRVQIAALLRAEVKAATKAGTLPKGVKVSVRCHGSSIDLEITALPFPALNPAWLAEEASDPHYSRSRSSDRYTPETMALRDALAAMAWAYNFDKSNTMTDHFHVGFYGGRAEIAGSIEDAERAAFKAGAK